MEARGLFRPAGGICLAVLFAFGGLLTGCTPDVKDIRTTGIELYRNRQYIESMATLRHAIELSRSEPVCNYYMGLNYRAMAERKFDDGDVAAAKRELDVANLYFTQAIKSAPNYLAAIDAQNETLELRGKYDLALAKAEHSSYINRGAAVDLNIFAGNEYRERGDFDNALRKYKLALAADPNSAQAYAAMGKMYLMANNQALAMDSFRRAGELDPNNALALEGMEMLSGPTGEVRTAAQEQPE